MKTTKLEAADKKVGLADEVSLVPRGANKKCVAYAKEDSMADSLGLTTVAKVLEIEVDGEDILAKSLGTVDADTLGAAIGTLRLIDGFRDKLTDERLAKVFEVAKIVVPPSTDVVTLTQQLASVASVAKEGHLVDDLYMNSSMSMRGMCALKAMHAILMAFKDELPETEAVAKEFAEIVNGKLTGKTVKKMPEVKIIKEDGTLNEEAIPEGQREVVVKLWKEQHEAKERAAKVEKELAAERDRRVMKELVDKADNQFKHLGGAEKLAVILKQAADAGFGAELETVLRQAEALAASGSATVEVGSVGSDNTNNEIETLITKEMDAAAKAGHPLSRVDAVKRVMKSNQDAYKKYVDAVRKQV